MKTARSIARHRVYGRYIASGRWRSPKGLLIVMAAAVPLSFAVWNALLNNFAIEQAAFTGREIGILQSLREVPGFLAFTVIFLLLAIREQTLALTSLCVMGIGVAMTGFFPTAIGLYCTTVLMSVGFHYFETVNQSLALQWLKKDEAAEALGRLLAIGSFASIAAYGIILIMRQLAGLDYVWVYTAAGGVTIALALFGWLAFPHFKSPVRQRRELVFRRRYLLYYALVFMSGARRQIFVVFAGFLMVEKFGYPVEAITLLFLVNCVFNMWLAPAIGRLIARWGESRALTFEYIGLIIVFVSYAFVENATVAAALYLVDHAFFALAIAIKTYFQKIADPADMAPTAGVSFTINHIAAVVIPVIFGFVWLVSPAAVFLAGAVMAGISLILSLMIPRTPEPGHEISWRRPVAVSPS